MRATPEDLGLSSQGLERARTHVASCVERGEIAGAVILVSRHDQVAQLACIGLRDIEAHFGHVHRAGIPLRHARMIASTGAKVNYIHGYIRHRDTAISGRT